MTGTFAALAADPNLSHAQALQKSMLALIERAKQPLFERLADPKFWAPFVVVGEPAKTANSPSNVYICFGRQFPQRKMTVLALGGHRSTSDMGPLLGGKADMPKDQNSVGQSQKYSLRLNGRIGNYGECT